MQIAGASCFAFLGLHKTAFFPAFALMPTGRWEVQNLSASHGLMPEYEGVSALDFGGQFEIKINYSGECNLDKGSLFRSPGAIIRTKDSILLAASAARGWRDPVQYLDLKTGVQQGEPGGMRAAFADWSVFLSPGDDRPLLRSVAERIEL
jgi:hypothetical protein